MLAANPTDLKQRTDEAASMMLDLAPNRTARRISSLSYSRDGIDLRWDDDRISKFHVLWLRDNCPCPKCRHPQALERSFKFIDHLPPIINHARLTPDGNVAVQFDNGEESHSTSFHAGWLRHHCYSVAARAEHERRPQLWDAVGIRDLPTIDFTAYMTTDAGFRTWAEALCSRGIALMRNAPPESRKLLDIGRRVGPIRHSNFGEYYDVISMPNPNASAYTSIALELHTDLVNWTWPPDYQLLFCIKNDAVGGGSVLADGFRVAEDLRREEPAVFDLLTSHPVEFRFHDQSCDIATRGPTITLDADGNLARIRFNNWLRGTLSVPEQTVAPLYYALGQFWRRLRDPSYHLTIKLEPGDMLAYDNRRILHGRESFDPNTGHRHLQGCYVTHDDLLSKLRLLERNEDTHSSSR